MKKFALAITAALPLLVAASSEEMLMAGEWAETATALSFSGDMPPPPNGLNRPETRNRCIPAEIPVRDFVTEQFGKGCAFGTPSVFDIATGKLSMAGKCDASGGMSGSFNLSGSWTGKSYDFMVSGDISGMRDGKPMKGDFAARIYAKRVGECKVTHIDATGDAAEAVAAGAEAVKAAADVRPAVKPKAKTAPRKTRKRR